VVTSCIGASASIGAGLRSKCKNVSDGVTRVNLGEEATSATVEFQPARFPSIAAAKKIVFRVMS